MAVSPSYPALIVHDDDSFRKSLVAALDRNHFTVTCASDGEQAIKQLQSRPFQIILVGLDLAKKKGLEALEFIQAHRQNAGRGIIILGDPHPELRDYAKLADETLMKPVDPDYVAGRARTYCA